MNAKILKKGKKKFRNLKISILFLVVVGIIVMLSGSVNAYSGSNGICFCGDGTTLLGGSSTDACRDCSAALNDNRNCANVVYYVGRVLISNYIETCIDNPAGFRNKVFDCLGNRIDGGNRGRFRGSWGIKLWEGSGNTIKNCIITGFHYGISLSFSSNNILANNTVNSNVWGISLFSSNNNILANNTVNSNVWGISLFSSNNNILANNTANLNQGGILLFRSSNNELTTNIASDNNLLGFYVAFDSIDNRINSNRFCSNGWYDIYEIYNKGNNIGNNNICNRTYNWNDVGVIGCTNKCIVMDRCDANIKYISNLEKIKNYATQVGCGPNAIANVLHYHNLQPNTPEGVYRRYPEYFIPCPSGLPGVCISDVNMTKIFNNITRDSSQLLTGLVRVSRNIWNNIEYMCPPPPSWGWWRYGWDRRINKCVLKSSLWNFRNCGGECREEVVGKGFSCEQRSIEGMDHAKVCVWNKDAVSLYKEIDASRPLILLITGYTGKIYTLDSTCKVQEWRGDDVCRNPVTNTNISGGHYVTVVGYTNDKRYLVISPGYDSTTTPCTPRNGLVLINVDGLTNYKAITFKR